jgi:hypothetical protein
MGAEPRKLVWLGAFAPGRVEIEDPYRMNDAAASALLDRLLMSAAGLLRHIAATPGDIKYSGTE